MTKTARIPAAAWPPLAASACCAFLLEEDRGSVGFNDGAAVTVGAADGVAVVGLDVVGAAVGLGVGSGVGRGVGAKTGAAVGLPGVALGAAVGRRVGDRVGCCEGRGLGAGVGAGTGAGDGAGIVGFALGAG